MQSKFNQNWINSSEPALSVVMLGFRRGDLLARAIASFRSHNSLSNWELVLVLNGASPEVKELGETLLHTADFPLLLIEASGRRPGAARNLGVARARGSLLLFLDDDIECFQDIGKAALELFQNPSLMAAGGANLTPPGSGRMERAAGYVLGSRLGAASMSARYRNMAAGKSNEHALILCNLAVRREAFSAQGGFATHLISNEENVLLQQLEREGHELWHSPRLAVFHRRRDNWRGTLEQAAKYGAGRAQNLLLLP
ncbi:MAG: glycosyltransferase, partial [Bdellovibrionota bacterium]